MMKSMKLMKSRQYNIITTTTGVAHRALLLLLLLVMSVGSVWGLTQTIVTDASLVHSWSGPEPGATDNGSYGGAVCNLSQSVGCAYGDVSVIYTNYADLSDYKYLKLVVLEGTPRMIFNREAPDGSDPNGGAFITIDSENSPYVTAQNSIWFIDLEKFRVNNGGYVHLNSIKGINYANVSLESITLYDYPTELSLDLYHKWTGVDGDATETSDPSQGVINFGTPQAGGTTLYGTASVWCLHYADLSSYSKFEIAYSGPIPRLLFNRQNDDPSDNGLIEINASSGTEYYTAEDGIMVVDLDKFKTDHGGYVHLNAIKVPYAGEETTVFAAHLYTSADSETTKMFEMASESDCQTHVLYQLNNSLESFDVDLAQFKDKILQAFGKSSLSEIGTGENRLYLRWYVLDKNTNKYLPVQNELLSAVGSSAGTHYGEDVGFLWFGGPTDANLADAVNVHVDLSGFGTPVTSTTYNQSNVTMVCVMTDDMTGLYPQHEPTNLKHKFIIKFISEWEAQNNSDFTVTNAAPSESFSKRIKVEQGAEKTATGQLRDALVDLYNQALASATSLNGATPQYVRVYLTNSSGTMIDTTKDDNWTSAFSNADSYQNKRNKGYVWAKLSWNSFSNDIFNTVLTKRSAYSWDDIRVVCNLTDDLTDSYFVGSGIMEEPSNLKARLIVSFKEDNGDTYSATTSELTTGMTIERKHNSTETAALNLAASDDFASVNAKFDGHLNDNTNLPKFYIRWYLADQDGEWVPTPEGITLTPVYAGYADKVVDTKNMGKVLHLGDAGAVVTADMLKMNIVVSDADVDLDDYQVVCALTYADEGYTTEPALKAKYIYRFKSPFEGKLSDGAIEHTKEVIVRKEDQTAGYVTIPLDDYYSEILNDYSTNASDLGNNFHIRWYLLHDNAQYRRSDLQLEAINSTAGYKFYVGSNDRDGYLYWNTATSGTTVTEGKLNVKFTIPTTDTHWENYKVVAVLSNNTSAENGQEVSGGDLTMEPQLLNIKYTFSLVDGVFKFVHYKGASGRDYFTHNDDVNINAPSGDYTMSQTTIFLPTENNVIGGRGDGFFISDRYTLGTAKESNINPATGGPAPEGAKYGGLTVKKDNPTKTAIFKVSGINSVVAYVVSTNKTESRTCYAKATPTGSGSTVEENGVSEHEGLTATITLNLDPTKEYVVDFSDCRKTGTGDGADMSLLGVKFVIDGTESQLYTPTQYTQYSWDNENSKVVTSERGDIRQGVHTVDYNVYINPSEGSKILKLPFESYEGSGNNLEPMAYIRWYDWSSDLGSTHLNKVGAWLKQHDDAAGNRGLFMLNNSKTGQKPTQARVGVTYDPSSLTVEGDIIACDVSKYYDGLYPGHDDDERTDFSGLKYPQFVHEPTLSTRYLFHIHPSSVIAKKINDGHTALTDGITSLNSGTAYTTALKAQMFGDICEHNGRVVVSLNGSTGSYALRANLYSLDSYYINNGNTKCSQISWYAFLENERGLWERTTGPVRSNSTNRIESFTLADLNGNYQLLSNTSTSKYVEAAAGMRFHLVGYVGDGSSQEAAVHYELQFLDAPAILAENLAATNIKRTREYLKQNFREGGVVDFDNYFEDLTEPTTEAKNMLFNPIPWKEAEYGFCYPSIDKYRIRTGWSGLTPIHGDYMLLKSMLRPNVSAKGAGDETPAAGCEYVYWWYTYDPTILYDYTHLVDNSKYGGYIYVDASDESRTIATLDFNANLCSGSQIYFTAAIADVTSGELTSPQLMAHVYAKNEFGEKTLVISFLTSVLRGVNAGDGGTYRQNRWYQVYGRGNIPENLDISNYTDFSVDLDNYSKDTNGADFCVDDIRFYTSTGKMQVEQTGGQCDNQDLSVTAYMDIEHLEAMVTLGETPKTLYYRIYKKTGEQVVLDKTQILFEPCLDPALYENGDKTYGQVDAYKCVLDENGALVDPSIAPGNVRYEIRNGIVYFKLLDDKVLNLSQGYEYYIAMTENLEYPDLDRWANPNDPCDVYSNFFIPRKTFVLFLDMDDEVASQTIVGTCDNWAAASVDYTIKVNVPEEKEASGFITIPDVKCDYFIGTSEDVLTGGIYEGLIDALQDYRQYEIDNSLTPSTELVTGRTSTENYNLLKAAVDAGKLLLSASDKFSQTITVTTSYLAIPLVRDYTIGETDYVLCDYIPFTFTVTGWFGAPELTIGFDDVDYSTVSAERVVRVGLEQLNKMKAQGYKLHIPVNAYKDKNQQTVKRLYFPTESYLTISETNDPTQTTGLRFAKIVPINGTDPRPWVDKSHMYLALDLSGENCAIDFHEGFEYEVSISYIDEDDEGDADACIGDLFLNVKVVPEFVTWYAQHVDDDGNPTDAVTDYWSANWYNDGNWQRSVRPELYKGSKGSATNTPTSGHPGGYENNTEINTLLTTNPGMVPMKFTYVTLPTPVGNNNSAPSLINEPKIAEDATHSSKRQGGGFLDTSKTTLLTDRSPNTNTSSTPPEYRQNSKPTENIYYDLLVRYGEYGGVPADHYGEGCFGHRYIDSDGNWQNQGTEDFTAKVFDCEKFYGNVCKEVYFKPEAELLRQHRLAYEKAWVEKELVANKWYMLSAPLKNMYAGDMYVPFSNGRQETEAFQPISFNTTTYSRTKYPFYQRSWGIDAKVYTKTNDVRATNYSAYLGYSTWSGNIAEWSHTYNDVQVPYSALAGFSVRAHKKNQANNTLIRLPKADTSYEYYDWSTPAAGSGATAVTKTNANKLVTDDHTNDGTLSFDIDDMQQIGDYVLIGNPYMVTIDMEKFFDTNNTLDTGYWTYEESTASAKLTTGLIRPLQAFFVKKGSSTSEIVFNKDMQIDGIHPTPPGGGARELMTMTAANDRGTSTASVELGDEEESVETLFDSNLSDVPMVYTVAGGQAVSINRVTELKPIAFGVTYNGEEAVDVTFSDIEQLTDGEVYVVDAVTGFSQTVHDGDAFSVQPNDYGRYFLVFADGTTGIDDISSVVDEVRKEYYDLRGHRVQTPRKGVYIVNGKKYLIK